MPHKSCQVAHVCPGNGFAITTVAVSKAQSTKGGDHTLLLQRLRTSTFNVICRHAACLAQHHITQHLKGTARWCLSALLLRPLLLMPSRLFSISVAGGVKVW